MNFLTNSPTPYVRDPFVPKQTFIQKNWWLGFIAMLVLFAIIVALLYFTIRWHFKEAEQDRRRKEIEENNGEFISLESASGQVNMINNDMYNSNVNSVNNNSSDVNVFQESGNRIGDRSHGRRRGNPLKV